MRTSIVEGRFPEFIKNFMSKYNQHEPTPKWVKDALATVNVNL